MCTQLCLFIFALFVNVEGLVCVKSLCSSLKLSGVAKFFTIIAKVSCAKSDEICDKPP